MGVTVQRQELIADYVENNLNVITNAMMVFAEKTDKQAGAARSAYEAGQKDPEIKARQDRSLITNHGYKRSSIMLQDTADKAREVALQLAAMIEEEGPSTTRTVHEGETWADCYST